MNSEIADGGLLSQRNAIPRLVLPHVRRVPVV